MISTAAVQLLHEYTRSRTDDGEDPVIAFMSQNRIDPDLAVEVFVLQPDEAD